MLGYGGLKPPSHHMAMRSRLRRDKGLRPPRPPATTEAEVVYELSVELTTILRHKYHSEHPHSLRQLFATVRRLNEKQKGYTYELAALAVRSATRDGQPRYEWKTICSNAGMEGGVEEEILFNLTSTTLVARNGNSPASSSNAPPPSIQVGRPFNLQTDPSPVFSGVASASASGTQHQETVRHLAARPSQHLHLHNLQVLLPFSSNLGHPLKSCRF